MAGEWQETTVGNFCPIACGKGLPDVIVKFGASVCARRLGKLSGNDEAVGRSTRLDTPIAANQDD